MNRFGFEIWHARHRKDSSLNIFVFTHVFFLSIWTKNCSFSKLIFFFYVLRYNVSTDLYTQYNGVRIVHILLGHLLDGFSSVCRHVHCLSLLNKYYIIILHLYNKKRKKNIGRFEKCISFDIANYKKKNNFAALDNF